MLEKESRGDDYEPVGNERHRAVPIVKPPQSRQLPKNVFPKVVVLD